MLSVRQNRIFTLYGAQSGNRRIMLSQVVRGRYSTDSGCRRDYVRSHNIKLETADLHTRPLNP